MNTWMRKLALHFGRMRRRYPDDVLMVVFDIDGTILDMRYLIHYVLKEFDRRHATNFFDDLEVTDVTVHESHVDEMLAQINVPLDQRQPILDFWLQTRWLTSSIMESHRPFVGVMEIIRWLQMRPNVEVGLNTERPESLRADTLNSLNDLGKSYNVEFKDELLHMNQGDWEVDVPQSKLAGVKEYQDAGYRVCAMVDNEPAALAAVSEEDGCTNILPLHAHTIFETPSEDLPPCSVCGTFYDLSDLVTEDALPDDILFAWHGVNDRANLRQFLGSDVQWGEVDVRCHPETGELILHHDAVTLEPDRDDEPLLDLHQVLHRIKTFEKSIKFDLKESGDAVDSILALLATDRIEESRLWFNANIEILGQDGFSRLRKAFPAAIVQCPIDNLTPGILDGDDEARKTLSTLRSWGVSRFSIEWDPAATPQVMDRLSEWGFQANIYNVPDLDSFLRAVLLEPRSITADFNFPEWHYYGRGSGQKGQYHEYSLEDESVPSPKFGRGLG